MPLSETSETIKLVRDKVQCIGDLFTFLPTKSLGSEEQEVQADFVKVNLTDISY